MHQAILQTVHDYLSEQGFQVYQPEFHHGKLAYMVEITCADGGWSLCTVYAQDDHLLVNLTQTDLHDGYFRRIPMCLTNTATIPYYEPDMLEQLLTLAQRENMRRVCRQECAREYGNQPL